MIKNTLINLQKFLVYFNHHLSAQTVKAGRNMHFYIFPEKMWKSKNKQENCGKIEHKCIFEFAPKCWPRVLFPERNTFSEVKTLTFDLLMELLLHINPPIWHKRNSFGHISLSWECTPKIWSKYATKVVIKNQSMTSKKTKVIPESW